MAESPIIVPELSFWEQFLDGLEDPEDQEYHDPLRDLHWRDWLKRMYPDQVSQPFGKHHAEMWDWAWEVRRDSSPDEFVAAWPRKGGKTTEVQLIVVSTVLRGTRRYWLYNCETQPQADQKVQNIAALFERDTVKAYYPQHAERALNKYKTSLGWNKTRCRTSGGGVVDSLGLNVAQRGPLVEGQPPDGEVFDDIDGIHDGRRITKKKERTIKSSILAAGTSNAMIMVAQNLIIPEGVVSRLASDKADYMVNRRVSGPLPAISDLKTKKTWIKERGRHRDEIIGGTPIWAGQGIKECQEYIDREGLATFVQECQNEVEEREGALWTRDLLNETRCDIGDLPRGTDGNVLFRRVVVGVDPSGGGDEIGIIAGGLGHNGHGYVLRDATQPGPAGPSNWGHAVIYVYDELEADLIVAESNFGGDLVKANIRVHSKRAPVKMVPATRGKAIRAEPVEALYEEDLVHHVGAFPELEAELTSWVPGETTESPNRLDALVWMITELMLVPRVRTGGAGTIRINRGR